MFASPASTAANPRQRKLPSASSNVPCHRHGSFFRHSAGFWRARESEMLPAIHGDTSARIPHRRNGRTTPWHRLNNSPATFPAKPLPSSEQQPPKHGSSTQPHLQHQRLPPHRHVQQRVLALGASVAGRSPPRVRGPDGVFPPPAERRGGPAGVYHDGEADGEAEAARDRAAGGDAQYGEGRWDEADGEEEEYSFFVMNVRTTRISFGTLLGRISSTQSSVRFSIAFLGPKSPQLSYSPWHSTVRNGISSINKPTRFPFPFHHSSESPNFPFPFAFNSPVNTRKLHYQNKTYPSLAAPTWKLTTISFLFSLCGFGCGWQDCKFLSPCISFLFLVYFEWR